MIGMTLIAGVELKRLDVDSHLGPQEAFLMVALAWFLDSVVGAEVRRWP